jgi:hypothetical protein
MALHKLPVLFALDRNPPAENGTFGDPAVPAGKSTGLQVTRRERVTTKKFAGDFPLTGEPIGNKIQLQSF